MSYWNSDVRIGRLSVPRFIGGPLDGLTDAPFRSIVRMFCQSELLYTEIRHVAAVVNMPRCRLAIDQKARPLNFQMTTHSTEYISRACEIVLEQGVDAVDLNIGCPASTVINSGSGSALMGDIPRLSVILREFRAALPCPFTVKMRAGFKEHNAQDVARLCQDCGVDALVVHPRLQKQKFKGVPDYRILASVKRAVSIPVIVSGGIKTIHDARAVYELTGVDGFLIGRAQLGAPWLLRQLHDTSVGKEYVLDSACIRDVMHEHVRRIRAYYNRKGLVLAKRHIGYYVRGMQGSKLLRKKLHTCMVWEDIVKLIGELYEGCR
jgi:tRNA-dihydrouridine synthase B